MIGNTVMKRKIVRCAAGVLCLMLALVFTACANGEKENNDKRVNVYCLNRDEDTIVSYGYDAQSENADDLIQELIGQLAIQPEDVELRPTVGDFEIVSYELTDNLLSLEIDENYRKMTPTTEILVRAALVRTLTQVQGVEYVTMHYHEGDLMDALGSPVGMMNAAQFIDNAGNEINAYEAVKLTLYFADEAGEELIKANRTVVYNSNISMEKLVVEQIIGGPTAEGINATVNPNTLINNVTVKDGICYVNLSREFLTVPEGVSADVTVYSIVNSLVEIPGVNKVQFSIDGETQAQLDDDHPFSTLYERSLEILR